jgi:hypothetical protein
MKRRDRKTEVEIQICPLCRSRRIQRVGSLEGDMTGAIGFLPPKFQCLDCSWTGRLIIMEIIDLQKEDGEKET